jgi:hypothetical protein
MEASIPVGETAACKWLNKTADRESAEGNWSGRAELNRRPLRPERSALTGLSHAPDKQGGIIHAQLLFGKLFAV